MVRELLEGKDVVQRQTPQTHSPLPLQSGV